MSKLKKKLMIQFQENTQTDRQTEGQKDGQILLYSTLPATTEGLTSKTANI